MFFKKDKCHVSKVLGCGNGLKYFQLETVNAYYFIYGVKELKNEEDKVTFIGEFSSFSIPKPDILRLETTQVKGDNIEFVEVKLR